MRIRKLSVDKAGNVILGAGASRGATCFDGAQSNDFSRPTIVVSHRPVRNLSVGIVRASDDSCNNARVRRDDVCLVHQRDVRPVEAEAGIPIRLETGKCVV